MIAAFIASLSLFVPQTAVFTPQTDTSLIRVHIRTDDGGDASELAARQQSVQHLRTALGGKKKAKLVVVDSDEAADIVIEVEGRAINIPKLVIGLSGGMGPQAGRPGPAATPVRNAQLQATIRIGRDADPNALTNKNRANDTESGWKSAAEDLAKQAEKWITERRTAILAARGKT